MAQLWREVVRRDLENQTITYLHEDRNKQEKQSTLCIQRI